MKKIILIISISLIISIGFTNYSKTIDKKQLQYRNGVSYEINRETPYKGKVVSYYEDGQIKYKETYKNGFKDGEWIEYYKNGQIKTKGNYDYRFKDGEWIEYYENGQIKAKGNYEYGFKDGKWIEYYENGKVKAKENYKDE